MWFFLPGLRPTLRQYGAKRIESKVRLGAAPVLVLVTKAGADKAGRAGALALARWTLKCTCTHYGEGLEGGSGCGVRCKVGGR